MFYTRRGDDGLTSAPAHPGGRVSKASLLMEALGSLDELNSFLGLCQVRVRDLNWQAAGKSPDQIVAGIQEDLFIAQAELAGAAQAITAGKVTVLETLTDEIAGVLPPIRSFLVSGGTESSAMFDYARTLARRAERAVIGAVEAGEASVSRPMLAYLNRLSSLLYALARRSNHEAGVKEAPPSYS